VSQSTALLVVFALGVTLGVAVSLSVVLAARMRFGDLKGDVDNVAREFRAHRAMTRERLEDLEAGRARPVGRLRDPLPDAPSWVAKLAAGTQTPLADLVAQGRYTTDPTTTAGLARPPAMPGVDLGPAMAAGCEKHRHQHLTLLCDDDDCRRCAALAITLERTATPIHDEIAASTTGETPAVPASI